MRKVKMFTEREKFARNECEKLYTCSDFVRLFSLLLLPLVLYFYSVVLKLCCRSSAVDLIEMNRTD